MLTAEKDRSLFGPHLIIDGSQCDPARLYDRLLIERILTDYPRAIGMTRIGGPYMFEYQAPDPAYSGVSGLVVIAESHIAIHTFPELDYFAMDIFSCKNFDHEAAIEYIRQALDVQHMDKMLVQRGLTFRGPHHGPLGATDDLIAAAAQRNASLGRTIGTIPIDDPLYPKADAGRMVWPAYGVPPDRGDYRADVLATVQGGARSGARVVPANAAAAGTLAQDGLVPIQPLQLNPTTSTGGVLERMATLGGPARRLGAALDAWERAARTPGAPVVLALGPTVVPDGLREVVTDLLHRGHVAALILADATLVADAYESLGFRHYVAADDEDATSFRAAEEWDQARPALTTMIRAAKARTPARLAAALGAQLAQSAPRPGILSVAAQREIPVILADDAGLADLGAPNLDAAADRRTLGDLLRQPGATLVAAGTGADLGDLLAALDATPTVIALGAGPLAGALAVRVDAALALPLLATALVQRLPQRPPAPASRPNAAKARKLLSVG